MNTLNTKSVILFAFHICNIISGLLCQEVLAGVVAIVSKEAVQHQGITLTMEGIVNLQLSSKSVGVFEAFYNSVKVRVQRYFQAQGSPHIELPFSHD